ncbi:MAG TPA: chemotaxis protein CheW [Polyangiaceae bacterium]|nr:chemotaxis protein CheW [Polyangiaceae bacterium]
MLFLLFRLGNDRYALPAATIAQVMPLVTLKEIPHALAGVAGVFNYRGESVPAIDLSQLALGRSATWSLTTRIVLVRYVDGRGAERKLGLIAECATEMLRCEASDFATTGVGGDAAPYLGPVTADGRGLIQWIEVSRLLPAALRDTLFNDIALSVPG